MPMTQTRTSQKNFIRYRFNGATCPACGTDCGGHAVQWLDGGKSIMCLHTSASDAPPGWKGVTKTGGWSLFWANTPQAKQEWLECVEESNSGEVVNTSESSAKGFVKKGKNLISQEEINLFMNFVRKNNLFSFNFPNFEGTKDLKKRGLSLEQIAQFEIIDFNGAYEGITIPEEVKPAILKLFGNKAVRRIEGGISAGIYSECPYYIIPVKDFDGTVRGFQLRRVNSFIEKKRRLAEKNNEKFKIGKYVWAGNYPLEGRQWTNACPKTGTAPLQILQGEKDCRSLLLTEGTLKPLIVHSNLGGAYHVMGASGGAFCGSGGLFLAALYMYKLKYGIDQVIWLADPGSYEQVEKDGKFVYKRNNVVSNIVSTKEFCEQHGFKFAVADWGQLEQKQEDLEPDSVVPQTIVDSIPALPLSPKERLGQMIANVFSEDASLKIDYTTPHSAAIEVCYIDDNNELPDIYANTDKRFIINNTSLGSGKSFSVNATRLDGFEKHIYVSLTPRNPATKELETEFYSLEGRHGGLVWTGNTTPSGRPVTRRPKAGEETQTDANCAFSHEHAVARKNGLNSGQLCNSCPFRDGCISGTHDHYNYLYQRIQADTKTKLRASLATLNPDKLGASTLITIDEPTSAAPFAVPFSINTQTARYYIGEINARLKSPSFTVDIDMVASFESASELLAAARAVDADIQEHLQRQMYHSATISNHYQGQRAVCHEWVQLLLSPKIKWTLEAGSYTTLVYNEQALNVIHGAGKVIFLDATCEPEVLAAQYQLPLDQCLVIRNTDKAIKSVDVNVLLAEGLNSRRQSLTTKREIMRGVRRELNSKYGDDNVGYITHSEFCEQGDIAFFSESRGSNRFKEKQAICLLGLPQIDLRAAEQQWVLLEDALSGWDFQNYYNHLSHSEIKQSIGRVRGYQRTEEKLSAYVVANCKLNRLAKEGYRVQYKVAAFAGVTEAYNPRLRALEDIYRATSELHQTHKKITQQAISEALGKTQQTISKSLKRLNLTLSTLTNFFQVEVVPGTFQSLPAPVDRVVKSTQQTVIDERFRFTLFDTLSLEDTLTTMDGLTKGMWPRGYKRNDITTLLAGLTYRMRQYTGRLLTAELTYDKLLDGVIGDEVEEAKEARS